VCKVGGKVYV